MLWLCFEARCGLAGAKIADGGIGQSQFRRARQVVQDIGKVTASTTLSWWWPKR